VFLKFSFILVISVYVHLKKTKSIFKVEEDMAEVCVKNPPERKPMKSSFIPQNPNMPSCIAFQPNVQSNFDLSPLLNMVPHCRGTPTEDPYLHIRDFFDLCKTQNVHGLNAEGIKLILFPFSLIDNAKLWLNSLAAGSIHNWEELTTKFLKKFFPAQRTRQLKREIQTFQQKDGDLFFEVWEHFNELLLKCPHHNLSQDDQVQAFYEGLNDSNKSLVDSAYGGVLMEKNSEEAKELFETLSENTQQFSSRGRQGLKRKCVYKVNDNNGVQTQMATLERKLDMLVKVMTTHNISPIQQIAQVEVCAICSHSDHTTETCPMLSFTYQEQANYVSQNNYPSKNNPYSNTYNAGWRNHPNFSWSNNQNVQNPQRQERNFQQGYNYQAPPQAVQPNPKPKKNDLESALLQFMTVQQQSNTQTSQAIQRLETQVGQLAKELSERKRGEFPMEADSEQIINHLKREREKELQSQLVAEPNGYYVEDWSSSYHEQAITTLRSEEVVENQEEDGNDKQIEVTHDLHQEKGKEVSTEASSALTPIPELPRCHESSLLGPLDEQTEVIKVEKLCPN
jgi:hypothetical protein